MEVVPILHQAAVAADTHAVGDAVEFFEGFLLHDITQPGREVALLVHPRRGIFHVEFAHGLDFGTNLGGSGEDDATLLELFGQGLHKLEDVGGQGLEDTEGAEFHEEVDNLVFFGQVGNPVGIGVCEEGIFAPGGVVKAETDVLGQAVVAEKEFEVRVAVAVVNEVRALPSEHVLGTFGKHTLEAHVGHHFTDFVGVDEATVTENFGILAEECLHLLAQAGHFFLEAFGVLERGESVAVGFGEEFDAARFAQLLEQFDYLGSVVLQLLNGAAREGDGTLEIAAVALGHFDEGFESGNVGTLGGFGDGTLVLVVIVIVMVRTDIEETVTLQVNILVNLKI